MRERNTYRILVGKPEGRPRRRWVDNIEMDHRELGSIWIRIETGRRLF
jgi:hypothetical protein